MGASVAGFWREECTTDSNLCRLPAVVAVNSGIVAGCLVQRQEHQQSHQYGHTMYMYNMYSICVYMHTYIIIIHVCVDTVYMCTWCINTSAKQLREK